MKYMNSTIKFTMLISECNFTAVYCMWISLMGVISMDLTRKRKTKNNGQIIMNKLQAATKIHLKNTTEKKE